MVTGGVDGALCPWGWTAQLATGHLTRRSDPARAYQPFGIDADGYVPAEGGAILVLEPADAAERRGAAQVYGEIAGYAATHDPGDRVPADRRDCAGRSSWRWPTGARNLARSTWSSRTGQAFPPWTRLRRRPWSRYSGRTACR